MDMRTKDSPLPQNTEFSGNKLELKGNFPDNAMGVFKSIEERWEAGSQGLMRLMEFSVESLLRSVHYGKLGDLDKSSKHINRSSHFTVTGAKLMVCFGDINTSDYAKFRETRDIRGNMTDGRLVELHLIQKDLTKDLLAIFHDSIEAADIDIEGDFDAAVRYINQNTDLLSFTQALIEANDAHKVVFAAHKSVCSKAVKKGEPSIRGKHIEDFKNIDFSPILPKLKKFLKEYSHE